MPFKSTSIEDKINNFPNRKYFKEWLDECDRETVITFVRDWLSYKNNILIQAPTLDVIRSIIETKHDHQLTELERFSKYIRTNYSVTEEKMYLKYGYELGGVNWNAYKNKQALTNTFEYKNEKYGMTQEEFTEYNLSRAVTKDNLVSRWGETVGLDKWKQYCENQAYVGVKYEYFIETYGDIIGREKYLNVVIQKTRASLTNMNSYTNVIFSRLDYNEFDNHETFYLLKPYEYHLVGNGPEIYFYDFACPSLKIILEYHENSHNNKTVKERDQRKLELAEEQGYRVYTLWEDDYFEDPESEYQKIKDWIYNGSVSDSSKSQERVLIDSLI